MTYRVPENLSFESFEDLRYDYYEIYHIDVFSSEDDIIMTTIDDEDVPVTDELLRDIHERDGNDGCMYIDEYGQVRLVRDDHDDEHDYGHDSGYESNGDTPRRAPVYRPDHAPNDIPDDH